MLNQIIAVGRLVNDPIVEEDESEKKVSEITLAIPRNFKNSEGEYDKDIIPVTLWGGIAENTCKYCKEGDLVAVKGRLQRLEGNTLQVVAEKINFLSSKKENEK